MVFSRMISNKKAPALLYRDESVWPSMALTGSHRFKTVYALVALPAFLHFGSAQTVTGRRVQKRER